MFSVEITQLLQANPAPEKAFQKLFPLIQKELRGVAAAQLQKTPYQPTWCTSALVNEAYIKLVSSQPQHFNNRAHFFAVAAIAMKQILINYANHKHAAKRGGQWQQVSLSDVVAKADQNIDNIIAVGKAVDTIRELDEPLAQLVELRFFAGLTEAEVAEIFDVSERTVRRNWIKAKILLNQCLG